MGLGTEMLGAIIGTLVFCRGRGEREGEIRVG